MTRETLKDLLPIMQAFVDGKRIEYSCDGEDWIETEKPTWDTDFVYRIKPEPKYRPFKTQEECWNEMHKHPDFGWVKNDIGNIFKIIVIFNDSIKLNECNSSYSELFKTFKFTDGTPFGIKEE